MDKRAGQVRAVGKSAGTKKSTSVVLIIGKSKTSNVQWGPAWQIIRISE
jgi:hypothetical protein